MPAQPKSAQSGEMLRGRAARARLLAILATATPDDWPRYDAQLGLLGASLLGQGRYADAEPAVVAGYEGMKAREPRIRASFRSRLCQAAERVVRLYEEWNKPG